MIHIKDAIGVALLGLAASFIGFCVYFDCKKRTDPYYKKRAEAMRFLERESILIQYDVQEGEEPKEHQFLHQIHLGEAKILCGDVDGGVRNLAKAVFICDRPIRLLQTMQNILEEDVFAKLMILVENTRQQHLKLTEDMDYVNKQMMLGDVSPSELIDKFSYSVEERD